MPERVGRVLKTDMFWGVRVVGGGYLYLDGARFRLGVGMKCSY